MSIDAIRRIQFCAGHRVMNHESRCRNMHGHNYVAYFHARSKEDLDSLGRVIDFSVIKERVGTWIDENWDHGFIYFDQDEHVHNALNRADVEDGFTQKRYKMKANPTAENMGLHLIHEICPMLFTDTDVEICKIVIYETENCSVEVTL